jgi:hypothetical protein
MDVKLKSVGIPDSTEREYRRDNATLNYRGHLPQPCALIHDQTQRKATDSNFISLADSFRRHQIQVVDRADACEALGIDTADGQVGRGVIV